MTGEATRAVQGDAAEAKDGKARQRLVILSMPFVRLARVTLSELVLGALSRVSDVVVVAPFADQDAFRRNFQRPNVTFFPRPVREHRGLRGRLYGASEMMRMNGYWHRHRDRGMAYYVDNALTVPGEQGNDTRITGVRALYYRLLAAIGRFPMAWRLTERLVGRSWYRDDELVALARRYEKVTVVQSANWGDQDRALARLSRENGWRTVLVPYTTDQLDMNGYLIGDFDAICPQGPFERERAVELHGVPASRLVDLGNAWFRHLLMVRDEVVADAVPTSTSFVLYAGISSLYFPSASELASVQAIAEYLARMPEPLPLVYRPVVHDPVARQELERFTATLPNVVVDWPSSSFEGMHSYPDGDLTAVLRHHVQSLSGCQLIVMSNTTSLLFDVALVARSGIIINRADATGVLARRNVDRVYFPWLGGVPIAHTVDELVGAVDAFFADPEAARRVADRVVAAWDFPHDDFEPRLLSAVFGSEPAGDAR